MSYISNKIKSLKNRLFFNSLRAIEVNALLLGKINTRQILNINKLSSLKFFLSGAMMELFNI